ncbi:DUF461 domain-containing protein [Streptomyces zingiberis]|uniref:DUF461 domain-containing protein n=1 Tax=Streptomyces zingiberis TaxID=2053010 RepID=A0ABX1BSH7_9ACTN|nr:DUF461 domain-containing protein [Streptomyces zingiberis]NJQ00023.1 DUF461 domain-containing protein [Streptomyces zingiberis]
MSRSLRRGILAATAVTFSLLTVAACGAGNNAATMMVRPDNASASVGDIKIQNVNVITQPKGTEGPAVVSAKIFNNGGKAQTLESVELAEGGTAELSPAKGSGPVKIPAGGYVIFGGEGNASAVLESPKAGEGGVAPVVFTLSSVGEVRVDALVMPAQHYFERFGPSSLPTPSGSPGGSPSGTPSGSASPSASAGGSESAGAGEGAANGDAGDTGGTADSADSADSEHEGH